MNDVEGQVRYRGTCKATVVCESTVLYTLPGTVQCKGFIVRGGTRPVHLWVHLTASIGM